MIRNPGAAFGLGSGFTIVFTVFAIVALIGCLYALTRITRLWHAIVLGLLTAGVTGNLIDRIFQPPRALHGHVVDMFQLPYFNAIFNVADMCITFAAVIMIIMTFIHDRKQADGA
nr:signal peptidase II [Tessaracoccus coleopterorum]